MWVKDKVIAVTVTFNDFNYLERAINYLKCQTTKLYKIVIVDNNSTLENKEKLESEVDDLIDIVWMHENVGGAGGFEAGMRYVKKKYNPDWIWLMDADAFPRHNCLEKLLLHKDDYRNIGILAPLIYGNELKEYQLYHHKKEPRYLDKDIFIYSCYDEVPEISLIEADAFVGPLISRNVIDNLGYVDGNLFIYGDDLEYTYRISRKYPIVLVKEAVINHRDQPVNGEKRPEEWWKDYYLFRNRLLFIDKYKSSLLQELIGIILVIRHWGKLYLMSYFLPYSKRAKKLRRKLLFKGIIDGLKKRTGKNVDPITINKLLKKEIEL